MRMKHLLVIALILVLSFPFSSFAFTQYSVEAESISGGTVIADADASNQQAVTRATGGIYTWWVQPGGSVPKGDYAVYVRARSTDGNAHTFTDLAYADENQIATLAGTVTSSAYHWYRLGEFSFTGSVLRLSDWSDSSMAIDKLIIEPIQAVNAKDVPGGTVIADPAAITGSAVTRTSDGIYTWWLPSTPPLLHGSYSVYVRARTQGVSSATFTEHVIVNGTEVALLPAIVNSSTYIWVPVGDFTYQGSSLRISDYSNAGLVIDQVRLVQDRPLDPTLGLYHLWFENVSMAGIANMEAENIAGGTVFDDINASNGAAVSRTSPGIYVWWNIAPAALVVGAQYSVDVRMRSLDGQQHNFGLVAKSQGATIQSQNILVSSTAYQWYKGLSSFLYSGQGLVLSDWSDTGLAVDSVRLELVSPQSSGYQQLSLYAQGSPATSGIATSAGRLSVLPLGNGQVYGYFRQTIPSNDPKVQNFDEHMGISNDGGVTFEVQPTPIISVSPSQNVSGFGSLVTAYDGSSYQTSNGFYLVFEGAGAHPFSSLIAYSQDGIHNWVVQGALVTPPSYNSSASTPNVVQDVESQQLYLQWVDVDSTAKQTTRHQASMSYLQSLNPNAPWPSTIWSDPTLGALPQSGAGTWDANNYGAGGTMYEDGYYYMVYEGADSYTCAANPSNWGLGIARTSEANLVDPTAWSKSPYNPILKAFDTGSCWVGYPQLTKIANNYYLYYSDPEVNWTPINIKDLYRRAIIFNSN